MAYIANHAVPFVAEIKLFTDGGSRGNPGPAAIGMVILDHNDQELETHSECIGHATNNRAEYRALLEGG
jgi:ribonuclease HI